MLLSIEEPDTDLLARHLALRISKQPAAPNDVLEPLKQQLPAAYQDLLNALEQHVRKHGSLAMALTEQQDEVLQRLGQLMGQVNPDKVAEALTEWLHHRQRLRRISKLVEQNINQQLMYFLLLLLVFCGISLIWLMFVAPTYNDLFAELSGDRRGPTFTQFLLMLGNNDHPVSNSAQLLITLLPFLAVPLVLLVRRQLKRLTQGQPLPKNLRRWPIFRRINAIQALFGTELAHKHIESLLTPGENLELRLAQQGDYLVRQLQEFRSLPEEVLAARVAAPLQKMSRLLTILLWIVISGFLVAAYQPIFSLGAAL